MKPSKNDAPILAQLRKDRIKWIYGTDVILTKASAYLSRTGQSVAVTLYGPPHPRFMGYVVKPKRVYIPVAELEQTETAKNLLNYASHKARGWLERARDEYWFALVIAVTVPLRQTHNLDLVRISATCRERWGDKYWRIADARAFLRGELRALGVDCPPDGPTMHFMPLVGQIPPMEV